MSVIPREGKGQIGGDSLLLMSNWTLGALNPSSSWFLDKASKRREVRGKVELRKSVKKKRKRKGVRLSKLATLKATDITPRREETVLFKRGRGGRAPEAIQ